MFGCFARFVVGCSVRFDVSALLTWLAKRAELLVAYVSSSEHNAILNHGRLRVWFNCAAPNEEQVRTSWP